MLRRVKSAGELVVEGLAAGLDDEDEWTETERLVLDNIRATVDRVALLRELLDAEAAEARPSSRRVTELAGEIRQCEANVVRWAQGLNLGGERGEKSARHQHAANVRWGKRAAS